MKNIQNRITIFFVLCSVLLFTNSVFATSVDRNADELFWLDTKRSHVRVSINESTAVCSGVIKGENKTSKISAEIRLQKKNSSGWTTIKSWSKTTAGNSMSFSETAHVSNRSVYRVYVKTKLFVNGKATTSNLFSQQVSS